MDPGLDDECFKYQADINDLEAKTEPGYTNVTDNLDARRRIERYQDLKHLREWLDDPGLNDDFD